MSVWADNPQAAQIDALIARAEQLTPVECDRLTEAAVRAQFAAAARVAALVAALVAAGVAAGDAARDAARFGAGVAAGAAARVAAGDAARDAARLAAWVAAGVAVRDRIAAGDAVRDRVAAWVGSWAAEALVVRDLIDEATSWNQAAYDVVTSPWRRVVGPIHPDDEVLR